MDRSYKNLGLWVLLTDLSSILVTANSLYVFLQARGYKQKNKTLEDVLLSTKRGEARLIGYDEEPIVMDDLEHHVEKAQILNLEDTLQSSDFVRGNDPLECSVNSKSSGVDLAGARITDSCNTSNVQTSESSANEKHTNTVGMSFIFLFFPLVVVMVKQE